MKGTAACLAALPNWGGGNEAGERAERQGRASAAQRARGPTLIDCKEEGEEEAEEESG